MRPASPNIAEVCKAFAAFQSEMSSMVMLSIRDPEEWKKKRNAALGELCHQLEGMGLAQFINWVIND